MHHLSIVAYNHINKHLVLCLNVLMFKCFNKYEQSMRSMRKRYGDRKLKKPFEYSNQKEVPDQSSSQESWRKKSQGLHEMP